MNPWIVPGLTFAGVLVTTIVSYLVAKRTSSGRIATSDAATLWSESQAMRKELRDELTSVRAEVAALKGSITTAEAEYRKCRDRLMRLETEVKHVREDLGDE